MLIVDEGCRGCRIIGTLLDYVASIKDLNMVTKEAISGYHGIYTLKKTTEFSILRVSILQKHLQIFFEKEICDRNHKLFHVFLLHGGYLKFAIRAGLEKDALIITLEMLSG